MVDNTNACPGSVHAVQTQTDSAAEVTLRSAMQSYFSSEINFSFSFYIILR